MDDGLKNLSTKDLIGHIKGTQKGISNILDFKSRLSAEDKDANTWIDGELSKYQLKLAKAVARANELGIKLDK